MSQSLTGSRYEVHIARKGAEEKPRAISPSTRATSSK